MAAKGGVCFSYMEKIATNLLVKILLGQFINNVAKIVLAGPFCKNIIFCDLLIF